MKVLFAGGSDRWPVWEEPLRAAFAAEGVEVDLATDHPPEEVDVIVFAPNPQLTNFRPFSRARAVLSLWAGVETIVENETLTQPLARMVDPGLTEGMVEYVVGHVLRHHLGIDAHLDARAWRPTVPPLARDRRVAVLGLGALGSACAEALARLNFDVSGWSRRPKALDSVVCHSGDKGLRGVLERSEIVILLLPLTEETQDLIDAEALARMPAGAVLINPGRGGLVVERDLLDALDRGHLAHATLDVFREEPLPPGHPFWDHPDVTVTPHIASETRPSTAAGTIARNVRRLAEGQPIKHRVDRDRGY